MSKLPPIEDQPHLQGDLTPEGFWLAPVRLTDAMLARMIDNSSLADMPRDELAEEIRGMWAEARYAAPRPSQERN